MKNINKYMKRYAIQFINGMPIPLFRDKYYNKLVNYYIEKIYKYRTRRRKDGSKYI